MLINPLTNTGNMKQLYAVPWYDCNMNCPHCEIHKIDIEEHFYSFLSKLMECRTNYSHIILFGGEPTLYEDKLEEIIELGAVDCVSTNLLNLPQSLLESKLDIATSWNYRRFTPSQYSLWLDNLQQCHNYGLDTLVMITMTRDLLESDFNDFLEVLNDIEYTGGKKFLLEHYIGEDDVNDLAELWIDKVYMNYKGSMTNILAEKLKTHLWGCDCSRFDTLQPTGEITHGCPQYKPIHPLKECLTCKMSGKCNPCALLKSCSLPHKTYKRLR